MNMAVNNLCEISLHSALSAGWKPWPHHEDFSLQFIQLARALDYSGNAIANSLAVLDGIEPGDSESWYREWKGEADIRKARADVAFADMYFQSAQSNWLQASAYYRSAGIVLSSADKRKSRLGVAIEECSRLYLESVTPAGEIVDLSCEGSHDFVRGYFLRAPDAPAKSPAVICFGGPEETRDELLTKMPRHALKHGLSLMVVEWTRRRNFPVEVAISACVDYLLARGDIDEGKIALFGNNLGAVDASRAASRDHRFTAAVCDGGIWDENQNPVLLDWTYGDGKSSGAGNAGPSYRTARRLRCPFLVTSGEYDFLDMEDAGKLRDYCRKAGIPMDLKWFSGDELGAVKRQFVFDWIAEKILNGRLVGCDYSVAESE